MTCGLWNDPQNDIRQIAILGASAVDHCNTRIRRAQRTQHLDITAHSTCPTLISCLQHLNTAGYRSTAGNAVPHWGRLIASDLRTVKRCRVLLPSSGCMFHAYVLVSSSCRDAASRLPVWGEESRRISLVSSLRSSGQPPSMDSQSSSTAPYAIVWLAAQAKARAFRRGSTQRAPLQWYGTLTSTGTLHANCPQASDCVHTCH